MKLHLGCGQRYLDGYVNIDFPLSSHTAQTESVADLHADIIMLKYTPESVSEVRLHHVFEHFPRPVACGLLACWYSWLKPGGVIHIEVPDFSGAARIMLNPLNSFKKRAVAERHLFGSHEASWAVHCEGYSPWLLNKMLPVFGFKVIKMSGNEWCGTCNVEVVASRVADTVTREMFVSSADEYLQNYLLNSSDIEMRIHAAWMVIFNEQLEKGWAQ